MNGRPCFKQYVFAHFFILVFFLWIHILDSHSFAFENLACACCTLSSNIDWFLHLVDHLYLTACTFFFILPNMTHAINWVLWTNNQSALLVIVHSHISRPYLKLWTASQDAFGIESQELCAAFEEGQEAELVAMCQRMSAERLELLLLQMYECITLRLSQPRDQDDDTKAANCKWVWFS